MESRRTRRIIIAAPADNIKDPYIVILKMTTSEHLKLYNKEIVGLPKSNRYDPTRSKCTNFNQELEDSVSKFGFKTEFQIVTDRDGAHLTS